MNSALFLEILNGASVTPESVWLVLLTVYLARESRRRGLRWFQWFHLPPSMDFMLAIFICDSGVLLRSIVVWAWRRSSADGFNHAETIGFIVSGTLIVLGFLCKVRAITAPDHGRGAWLASSAATVVAIVALLIFR